MVLSTFLHNNNDALCITQPSPMTSFDWSDFPLVHQFNPDDENEKLDFQRQNDVDSSLRSFEPTSNKRKLDNNDLSTSYSPVQRTCYPPSLSSSDCSLASSCTSDLSSSDRDNRVSFAPRVEVRHYDLVLGDHPSCDDLPLSLDWTYSEATYQDYSSSPRRHGNQLRLSYWERKNLLIRVGGYTADELSPQRLSPLHHVPTATKLSVEASL